MHAGGRNFLHVGRHSVGRLLAARNNDVHTLVVCG